MEKSKRSLWGRVVFHYIPPVASLSVAGIVVLAATLIGQAPGPLNGSGKLSALFSKASDQVFYADPNPAQVCPPAGVASTTLRWSIGEDREYQVRQYSASGPILAAGKGSGSRQLSGVPKGTNFALVVYKVETTPPLVYTYGSYRWEVPGTTRRVQEGTYQVSIAHTTQGCSTQPPADPRPPTEGVTPPAQRVITCSPTTQTVEVGKPVTITTNSIGRVDYNFTWSAVGASSVAKSGQTLRVTYATAGSKAVTVTDYKTTATCTVTVTQTLTAPAPPPVPLCRDAQGNITHCNPNPTPPPPAQQQTAVGVVDASSCDTGVSGWAADLDSINGVTAVRIMLDGSVAAEFNTNTLRTDVNSYLSSTYNAGRSVSGNHGFVWQVPASFKNGRPHALVVEAKDSTAGRWHRLSPGAGHTVNVYCQAPVQYLGEITVPESVDVCPGPDGLLGIKKVNVSAWAQPNGGSVYLKDSNSGQDQWFMGLYGPSVQSSTWTAKLGHGQSAVSYTFRVSTTGSGSNTVATKVVQVRPISGTCDPAEYKVDIYSDGTPFCPRNNQYPRIYATGWIQRASSQPAVNANDKFTVRYRPSFTTNWQNIAVTSKSYPMTDPNMFYFQTSSIQTQGAGDYEFNLNFRGHVASWTYSIAPPNPFCQ